MSCLNQLIDAVLFWADFDLTNLGPLNVDIIQ